jgi:hypothetical protein
MDIPLFIQSYGHQRHLVDVSFLLENDEGNYADKSLVGTSSHLVRTGCALPRSPIDFFRFSVAALALLVRAFAPLHACLSDCDPSLDL